MRRRDFVARLGGLVLAWPVAVHAQQPDRVRRVAVLMGYTENDADARLRFAAFKEGLVARGWSEGAGLHIDVRWTGGDAKRAAALAKELVALKPDVILAHATPATSAIKQETRTVATVFVAVSDPQGSGFVKTLSRPGGNITGLRILEASLTEKWLQLLKEVAPRVKRVAVVFNPKTAPYAENYLQPLKTVAPRLGVEAFRAPVDSQADIERVVAELGREPGGGLLCMIDTFTFIHRRPIIAAAAQYKIPAIYPAMTHVEDGGLIGYGADLEDQFRRSAGYVDRILRGAKPQDLPVEHPSKYELAVNRRTAKALGIKIPQTILARADKLID